MKASVDEGAAKAYWVARIGIDPAPLELPRRAGRPQRKGYPAQQITLPLNDAIIDATLRLSEQLDTSFATICLAAYLVVLRRWSQQDTLTVGRVVNGPPDAVGAFQNLLPFRADFEISRSFATFVRDVSRDLAQDAGFDGFAFDRTAKLLQKSRDPSRHPVFQALFRYDDAPLIQQRTAMWSVLEAEEFERLCTPFDQVLEVSQRGPSGAVRVLFDPALFETSAMQRFAKHFVNLLVAVSRNAEADIDAIPILDADETERQHRILNSPVVSASSTTVLDQFATTVQASPRAPAVSFEGTTLSYLELDRQTSAVAAALRARGVARDVCVGVCFDRSIEMVATVLGVLKAGGAYVPMDPSYPAERLAMMAEDSGAPLIIAGAGTLVLARDAAPSNCQVIAYRELVEQLDDHADHISGFTPDADALAYVIFTSGSTGRPKGVAMPHRALANLIDWQLARETFRPGARVLQYSSLSFDVSFQELFSTWASGGHLHLIADDERRDPRRLLDALEVQRIERLFLPYVALRQMVEVARATHRAPSTLREVITAGEQLCVDDPLRAFFSALPGASLDNQYGPSETHVVTAQLLRGDPTRWADLPPIGTPIQNNQAFVFDKHLALLPEGVAGELYLAGVNLARGYIGRDDLTRERFLPHPFEQGARVYKTGDTARYGADGAIEYLGRADNQVKVRGYRIEPGEVGSVLARFAGVKQCLVTAIDDHAHGKRLVAYALVADASAFSNASLMEYARATLPQFMVPSALVVLEAFPFTPSGKVDIRALPAPLSLADARPGDRVPPETQTQNALAKIWAELLEIDDVGIRESFFDLGGDSLSAVQLFLAIDREFGHDLPLSLLAENPTIESLADIIDRGGQHELSGYRSLRVIQRGDAAVTPLFMAHGGGGNVVLFRDLAKNLGEQQPVYAFEWDGWSNDRGQRTIEAMAALYASELTRFLPQGDIRLGGHCIGGLIAIELAQVLRGMGRTVVDPLIITDAPNLNASTHRATPSDADTAALNELDAVRKDLEARVSQCPAVEAKPVAVARMRRSVTYQRVVRMAGRIHRLLFKTKFNRFQTERWLDGQHVRIRLLFGLPMPRELRESYCARTMVRAALRFRSKGYDGDILFFRTRTVVGQQMGLPGWWADPYFGFDELCNGTFSAHFINAEHNEVVGHPRSADLIRQEAGLA